MGSDFEARALLPGALPELLAPDLAAAVLDRLLDELDCGVLVLDRHARLVLASESGRALLARRERLAVQGGTVAPVHADDRPGWQKALRRSLRGDRQLLLMAGGTSLALSGLQTPVGSAWHGLVLVLAGRAADQEPASLQGFGAAYGLTNAELRVLAGLARGLDARAIAGAHGTSQATVRTQIKSLLAKTQAGNVRVLLLRLHQLPPVPSGPLLADRGEAGDGLST